MIRTLLLLLALAGAARAAIVIGPGPALGTDKRGVTWFQEFQDWSHTDVKALDQNNDQFKFNNAHDTARDIIAVYAREEGDHYYFRVDFFDLLLGSENGELDVYVAIDCAAGGQQWLPDFTDTRTSHPWEICIALYSGAAATVYDSGFNNVTAGNWLGSYWRADLDSVEFGIKKSLLTARGWTAGTPINFQVFTTRDGTNGGPGEIGGSDLVDHTGTLTRDSGDGTGFLNGAVSTTGTVNRAKYAAIAHANQSIATRTGTSDHIFKDYGELKPGFIRTVDSHEFFNAPLNMHLSGSLISSLLWARSTDPTRDGPTFLNRLKHFIQSGTGSLIGGVYSEHIMPYFEGEVNRASIRAFNDLALDFFNLTTNQMKVMHTPERVFHSNTNWFKANPSQPLKGKPFEDILAGGYVATYLDEVTHLHWWFYPNEQSNPGWDDNNWGRWAGGQGNDEEPYHHKIHKINGVLVFMINDREDQSKFGNDDGGMLHDTRYTLLQKALSPDYAQITIVFDDWEAYAGNSFGQGANNNADQWHNTIRWAANHQWIQIVNLKDVVTWAQSDPNWVIDHGYVYDKTMQTYEWLKKATQHSYDHWYFGFTGNGVVEENFAARVPGTAPSGFKIPGTKAYGDMNTPGTLIRDSWDKVAAMPAGNLKRLAEWTYSSMIYETAWHDENPPSWWCQPGQPCGNWFDAYQSRNYQVTFNRPETGSYEDSNSNDPTSGWALRLHGHIRKVGIHADAAAWVQAIKNGTQGPATVVEKKDVDDDLWDEYILKNNRVYLCFKRWGGRLIYAFVFDPAVQDAHQVIGVPAANPAEEHDGEGADNNRCSGFKDRYASAGANNFRYVDDDYAVTPPLQGSNFWEFVSSDGAVRKRLILPAGRDAVQALYTIGAAAGTLYIRHGLGPNQMDILLRGDANLVVDSAPLYYGLRNTNGGAAYAVNGANTSRSTGSLPNAGYQNRELPLIEQVEQFNTATNASLWLAFSLASAQDIDGDGIPNDQEPGFYENPDRDGDGMPDGFEQTYFGSPTAGDPSGDNDGDGQTNLQEFLAGTNPVDAASSLRIVSIVRQPNQDVTITATSVPGRKYVLKATPNLGITPFGPASPTNTASSATITFTDPAPAIPHKHYRVDWIP
jgi:hypothetical protein